METNDQYTGTLISDLVTATEAVSPRCTRDPNTCNVGFCDFPRCLDAEDDMERDRR